MAVIKSGSSTDQWTIDPTSKAGRITLYSSAGTEITTLPVGGTVELGSTTLAALENITVTVSSTVDLSSGTLAALESITVQNGSGASAVNIQDGGNSITVDGTFWQATQPVSNTNLDVALSTRLKPADTLAAVTTVGTITNVVHIDDNAGSITVDGTVTIVPSGTQTITGTVTANIGTTGGLALDATLTGGTQQVINRGGAKGATTAATITSTAEGTDHQGLDVQIYHGGTAINPTAIRALTSGTDTVTIVPSGTQTISGTVTANAGTGNFTVVQATAASLNATVVGTGTFAVQAAQSGTWNITNISGTVSLPTGAATETTLATLLSSSTFTGRINTQGQKTMAASTPVVLASDQSAIPVSQSGTWNVGTVTTVSTITNVVHVDDNAGSLTVDGTIAVSSVGGTVTVSGTVAATQSGSWSTGRTWTLGSGTDTVTIVPSGTQTVSGTVAATQSGTWNIGTVTTITNPVAVTGTFFQATQPVSGTVTANAGTNLNTSALALESGGNLTTINTNTSPVFVSINNSSTAALTANSVFTGTAEDISSYSSVSVSIFTNQASATDGLSMQQSPDGTNWDLIDPYTVPASSGKTFGIEVSAKFFRLVYTNGSGGTATLRIQTIFHKFMQRNSSVRPQDARPNDNDMEEGLAYLMGYNGTTWDRIRSSNTGALVCKEIRSTTGTLSNVASSITNVNLLASNANRLGATIANDSTSAVFVKLGATASSTSFTVKIAAAGYYEVPGNYTGQIDAIWVSANGSARMTELT